MKRDDWAEFAGKLTPEEFMCKCGSCTVESANNMNHAFMHALYLTRLSVGRPFVITSGYRCPRHPKEVVKDKPGDHADGRAADIGGSFDMPVLLLRHGLHFGLNVFGWHHKGPLDGRFTHVAQRKNLDGVLGYTY